MTAIPEQDLFTFASRIKDCVVIITGGGNGIGKETALKLAQYGAKLVLADVNLAAAESVATQIVAQNGQAVAKKCDVTQWDDQLAVFEHALKTYGSVDVVLANAGVTETSHFFDPRFDDEGLLRPPNLKTIDVNLTGVLFTTSLARHYLTLGSGSQSPSKGPKALILVGSIASWQAIPLAPYYTATKHAVLGVMRSITHDFEARGIRTGCIHPFFADTEIVSPVMKAFLAGVPLIPVPRIAGTIVYAMTSPSPEHNGASWMLMDANGVVCVQKEMFKEGVYKVLDQRVNSLWKFATGIKYYVQFISDIATALKLYKLGYLALPLIGLAIARMFLSASG